MTLLHSLGTFARSLPNGPMAPVAGQGCAGSSSALGTGNVGNGTQRETTIVNLWRIHRANAPLGWVVKTFGRTYWYEDPRSAYYEQITPSNADELHENGVAIGGCFHGDLAL